MPLDRRLFLACACSAGAGLAAGIALPAIVPALSPALGPPPPGADPGPYARERFLAHWNCTQAVLEALAGPAGLAPEEMRRIATPFAAGMWSGLTCGAATGAMMALGLRFGRATDGDSAAMDRTRDKTRQLVATLRARHPSLDCSALLGVDMATDQGMRQAADRGLFKTLCPGLVETCAREAWRLMA